MDDNLDKSSASSEQNERIENAPLISDQTQQEEDIEPKRLIGAMARCPTIRQAA
jgi:hypothetical protein